jgi:hypothetical protein
MYRALACLVTLALAAPAGAAELTDQHGFQMNLSASAERTCVVIPEQLQRAKDCTGMDLPTITTGMRKQMSHLAAGQEAIGVAFLVGEKQNTMALALSGEADVPTSEGIDEFIRGFLSVQKDLHPRRDAAGSTWTRFTMAGTPAVRFAADGMEGVSSPALVYFVYGEARMYILMFMALGPDEAATQAVVDKLLASVKLAPLSKGKAEHFAESAAYRQGYRVGYLVGRAFFFGIILVVGVMILRARRKRQRTPPPT